MDVLLRELEKIKNKLYLLNIYRELVDYATAYIDIAIIDITLTHNDVELLSNLQQYVGFMTCLLCLGKISNATYNDLMPDYDIDSL